MAASLRPELLRVIAEAYLQAGSWEVVRRQVLTSNSLQARSSKSSQRLESELRHRLERLTAAEIELAAHGVLDERVAIAWLAALKASSYIYAFAADLLRGKLSSLDPVLRASDYEAFFENQSSAHPDILDLAPSSRAKVRSMLLTMTCEAGLGQRVGRELRIHRPIVPPAVRTAILHDSPHWLAGYLVFDPEIPAK
jgi:hypothetical protein